ncbi:MAG: hypothetical protein COZ12_01895, partial [Deltaproteobacteria bacterium CG_4_10_14_3_um_filter_60_8]
KNNMVKIALRFESGLVVAIEQNHRRSRATSRISESRLHLAYLRLSCGQRWLKDEMQDDHVIF